ncbi:MAG: ABC transporter ATP-binding protein [Bacteriovoracaceae bacterium]|nr:ABC transporter ATP-binding protein [Bacteriovoracaceae bacterium]
MKISISFFRNIVSYLRQNSFWWIAGTICLALTQYAQSYLPFYAKSLGDTLAQHTDQSLSASKILMLAFFIFFFRTLSRLFFFYPSRRFQHSVFKTLLEKVEETPPERYRDINAGQFYQILYEDLDWYKDLFGFVFLHLSNIALALVIILPSLAGFSKYLLLPLLPMIVSVVLFTIILSRFQKHRDDMQYLQGEVSQSVMESYEGKKTIKNYHAEKYFSKSFRQASFKELKAFTKTGLGFNISTPLIKLGVGCSLLWGAFVIKTHHLGATSLILFSGFVFLLTEPLMFMSWVGYVIGRSWTSWKRIRNLLLKLEAETVEEKMLQSLNQTEKIVIPFWSHHIEFSPRSGWTVFVGETGCGKSTFLLRLAQVFKLKKIKCSLVDQNPYLYNDTIFTNIFLGKNPTPAEEQLARDLLSLFSLNDLAQKGEDILTLEVGENGKLVSGGEAKRICLVRSLLSSAHIYLWDDPFSSVDVILEKKILEQLRASPFMQGKSIYLNSHRLSTVKLTDEVVFLDKNLGIVEQVAVTEIKKAGRIHEFFQKQLV